jgi:hypothetical protein
MAIVPPQQWLIIEGSLGTVTMDAFAAATIAELTRLSDGMIQR